MSRSGYIEDMDDQWQFIRWRGAVRSAIRGKRGQSFLREMLESMDALPSKALVANDLQTASGEVCAIGSVGQARGIDMSAVDPEDSSTVASTFGIAEALAKEVVWINDEDAPRAETPEWRFERVRKWIVSNLRQSGGQENG